MTSVVPRGFCFVAFVLCALGNDLVLADVGADTSEVGGGDHQTVWITHAKGGAQEAAAGNVDMHKLFAEAHEVVSQRSQHGVVRGVPGQAQGTTQGAHETAEVSVGGGDGEAKGEEAVEVSAHGAAVSHGGTELSERMSNTLGS